MLRVTQLAELCSKKKYLTDAVDRVYTSFIDTSIIEHRCQNENLILYLPLHFRF
jgi:hypothetical protein